MDRPTHAGLRHIALNARQLEAMTRFYVDILGFDVEWEPDPDNVYLSSGIDNLALHRASGAASSGESALDHFGLIVRSAADVDRWALFLESRGDVFRLLGVELRLHSLCFRIDRGGLGADSCCPARNPIAEHAGTIAEHSSGGTEYSGTVAELESELSTVLVKLTEAAR